MKQPVNKKPLPRGLRNNNPLNIRIGNVWLGEVANPTDPDFEQFVSIDYGLRAAFVLLRRYIRHYRRTTIPAVISAWAPATENNVTRYVDVVCSTSGILPDAQLAFEDVDQMVRLVDAMVFVECGRHIPKETIHKAYHMA